LEKGFLCVFPFTSNSSNRHGLVQMDISPDQSAEIIYGFWAIGFVMLNLTKEKEED
jgi:hypothetical protein